MAPKKVRQTKAELIAQHESAEQKAMKRPASASSTSLKAAGKAVAKAKAKAQPAAQPKAQPKAKAQSSASKAKAKAQPKAQPKAGGASPAAKVVFRRPGIASGSVGKRRTKKDMQMPTGEVPSEENAGKEGWGDRADVDIEAEGQKFQVAVHMGIIRIFRICFAVHMDPIRIFRITHDAFL